MTIRTGMNECVGSDFRIKPPSLLDEERPLFFRFISADVFDLRKKHFCFSVYASLLALKPEHRDPDQQLVGALRIRLF